MVAAVIFTLGICVMAGIGIFCLQSKTPVTFYSGETPPKPEQVKDVKRWNRKHGILWLGYAGAIALGFAGMRCLGDTAWSLIPFVLGVAAPLPIMVRCHERWKKIDLI